MQAPAPHVPENRKHLWRKGQSGNPRGSLPHIRSERDIIRVARGRTRKCLDVMYRIMCNKNAPHMARLKAAELLLERGWGKAPQTITLTDESERPVDVLELARRVAYLLAYAERQAQAEDAEILPSAELTDEEKEQT